MDCRTDAEDREFTLRHAADYVLSHYGYTADRVLEADAYANWYVATFPTCVEPHSRCYPAWHRQYELGVNLPAGHNHAVEGWDK